MKPRKQGGVVDERLNVYGVQNLKIAGNYPVVICYIILSLKLFLQTAVLHREM